MEGGFKESPLKLNEGLGQLEQWNEEAIKTRAQKLAGLALRYGCPRNWRPTCWRPTAKQDTGELHDSRTIRTFCSAGSASVFEAFRKEVLALDPCVTEEFLKLYVAYKAETNFVDVVPQAKRLRLSLNMRFRNQRSERIVQRRNGHGPLGQRRC